MAWSDRLILEWVLRRLISSTREIHRSTSRDLQVAAGEGQPQGNIAAQRREAHRPTPPPWTHSCSEYSATVLAVSPAGAGSGWSRRWAGAGFGAPRPQPPAARRRCEIPQWRNACLARQPRRQLLFRFRFRLRLRLRYQRIIRYQSIMYQSKQEFARFLIRKCLEVFSSQFLPSDSEERDWYLRASFN